MKNTVVVAYSTSNESKSLRINISHSVFLKEEKRRFFLKRTLSTKKMLHFSNVLPGFFSCSVLFRFKESGRMEPTVQMWILSTDPTISGYSLLGTTLETSTCTDIPASVKRYLWWFCCSMGDFSNPHKLSCVACTAALKSTHNQR